MRILILLALLAGCQGDTPDIRVLSPSCTCQQSKDKPAEPKKKELK